MISLANTLLPSSCDASLLGPNTASPCSSKRSVSPTTSGASGPMTVRSTSSRLAKSSSARRSSAAMGTLSASAAVPALPGAQKMRSASGDWAKEWTRACSLPPPPTTSTRMRPPGGVALRRAALPPARPDARKSTRAGHPGEGVGAVGSRERQRRAGGPAGRPPPPRQIDFWYTRKARVASQVQITVNSASQPMRVSTRLQSGLAARPPGRPAPPSSPGCTWPRPASSRA